MMLKIDENYQNGFIATTAVIVISFGIFAFGLAIIDGVFWYSDAVRARERRIQHRLDDQACIDTGILIRKKDVLLDTDVYVSEFDCIVEP